MSSRTHIIGLKVRIAEALLQQGYQHPYFTKNGERGGAKMSNKQIRSLARNLGVSMKEKENRLLLKSARELKSLGDDEIEVPAGANQNLALGAEELT